MSSSPDSSADLDTTSPIILGTAGHIDHGKTSLVRALTGIDTDRLKEEKERGITIELGFAHLEIGGRQLGIVDVPGHERFVKAMVAGAAGIDLVMLVIAADEGIMPQTREHLDICELLGVKRGLVVLTKVDLQKGPEGAEWLTLVEEEVRRTLDGTFLAGAPIVRFSATTGEGKEALLAALETGVAEVRPKDAAGPARLPIDRVFTMKGFGTVVTGTLISGQFRVGDAVTTMPSRAEGKLRGLQVHGAAAQTVRAGMRVAANLMGLERQAVERGEVLTLTGALEPSSILDVDLRYLRSAAVALGRRNKVLFHCGTTQVLATLVLLESATLEPGQRGLCQVRLQSPVIALPGDRFIIRGFRVLKHHGTTIGGGEVLRAHPAKHRLGLSPERRRELARQVALLARMRDGDDEEGVLAEIEAQDYAGIEGVRLKQRFALAPQYLEFLVGRLAARGKITVYDRATLGVVLAAAFQRLCLFAVAQVDAFHKKEAAKQGMAESQLRGELPEVVPPKLAAHVIARLIADKELVAEGGDIVRRPKHVAAGGDKAIAELKTRLVQLYAKAGFSPPRTQDLPSELGEKDARRLRDTLALLEKEGAIVKVSSELSFAAELVVKLREKLVAHIKANGEITAQAFKEMVGASRKYTIPLAEYFDSVKLTMRVGEVRKLRGANA